MLRRVVAHVYPSIAVVWLIALIAAMPLLTRPGLPRHTDLELHVFRTAEFQTLLADRPLEYPRWAPNFYYGFGYPIFNYYAPLTYYAASVVAFIPGLSVVAGMKAVLVVTFVLAAFGTFFLARRHFGSTAGVAASAAYVLSPYLLFIDPFMRGDAAEFLALGILPWVFLAFDKPLQSARDVARAASALAALVFSHNLMALIGAALLAAWIVWRGLLVDGVGRWARDLAAIGMAAGLTAVFWLPFFAERDLVRLDVAGPGHFDFRNHFIDFATLLQPSPALDLGATTPHFIYNLGLGQWLLALPALFGLRRLARYGARITAYFILAAVFLIFLITPASQGAWEAVPPAALIQFPWRFLGPAAFMLAMCAAGTVALLPRPRIVTTAALGVLVMAALPTMYPPLWDADFGDVSPKGIVEFELSGVARGTTSTDDFLPRAVMQVSPPVDALMNAYLGTRPAAVDRLDYDTTLDAQITPLRLSDLDAEYAIESMDAGFTANFFLFAFPGWQPYVDGRPVPMKPPGGLGFISFDVPVGARTFGLRFESTPSRMLGAIVSIVGAMTVLVVAARSTRRDAIPMGNALDARQNSVPLVLLLIAFLAIKILIFDRCDTCFRYTSPPGQALAASNSQYANFGDHIALLGYDLSQGGVVSGQTLPLTLYWKAIAPVPINYQVFAHLARPPYVLWGQSDKLNPGDFPTTRWPLDKYVWDDHVIRVLPGTPPGEYDVFVGLYTLADGRRAPVIDGTGAIVGDSVQLRQRVQVVRPSAPPSIDSLEIQTPLDLGIAQLNLLGASIEQVSLPRPSFARLTLFWRSLADGPASVTVHARLLDARGDVAIEIVAPPTGDSYPVSLWRADEIVRDVYAFWLPPDFDPGVYSVSIQVENDSGQIRLETRIGDIEVVAP